METMEQGLKKRLDKLPHSWADVVNGSKGKKKDKASEGEIEIAQNTPTPSVIVPGLGNTSLKPT